MIIMANYMLSNYVIEGKKAELDEFEAMLRRLEAMKEEDFPIKDVSWGSTWLGFIINELGQDWNGYNCKGTWYDLERRGGDALAITFESAWEAPEGMLALIAERWPSFKYYFYREEPGSEVFETNDVEGKYFPRRYYLRGLVPNDSEEAMDGFLQFDEYMNTEEDALAYMCNKLNHPIKSLADIETWNAELEKLSEENDDYCDCYIYMNEIDVLVELDFDGIEPIC